MKTAALLLSLLLVPDYCCATNWQIWHISGNPGAAIGDSLTDASDYTAVHWEQVTPGSNSHGFSMSYAMPSPTPNYQIHHFRFYLRARLYPHHVLNWPNSGWNDNVGNNTSSEIHWTSGINYHSGSTLGAFTNDGNWQDGLTPIYTVLWGSGLPWTGTNSFETTTFTFQPYWSVPESPASFFAIDLSEFELQIWVRAATCPEGYPECEDYDDSQGGGNGCPGCGELVRVGDDAPRVSTWGRVKALYRP